MRTSSWAPPAPATRSTPADDHPGTGVLPTPTLREAVPPAAFDRRTATPTWFGEVSHHDLTGAAPRDVRGLVPAHWCKRLWLVAQVAAVALVPWQPWYSFAASLVALLSLMTWSGLAALNVRRARPHTAYSGPPSGVLAASSWLYPILVVALAVMAADWLERTGFASDLDPADRTGRIRLVVTVVAVIPFLWSLWVPYGVLGRATAWAGGSSRRWRHFFWLPALCAVLVGLVRVALAATTGLDLADGALSDVGRSAFMADAALALLPILVTWWLGWAAMTETERASRLTWEKRNFPEGTLDLSDEMAGRAAVASYLASHPNG